MGRCTLAELDIAGVIGSQAYAVWLRFKTFVEQDDLEQEAWVWVLSTPAEVKEFTEGEEPVELRSYRLGQRVGQAMDRYARRQKAYASGYEPEDELFYSDAVINVVLPSVLKEDPRPPVRDGERIANTSDPAEGGVWIATYLDVKKAWKTADLTPGQRKLLVSYYRDGENQSVIAEALGVSQQTVAKRLKRARTKLIAELGGRQAQDETPRYDKRPGTKRNQADIYETLK